MSKKIITLVVASIVLLAFVLSGCGQQTQQSSKVINVGTNAEFAPFEFQDDKSKDYIGFDMDLIKAIAKQMGYEAKIQNMGFDGLIPALEAGNIDVVASGMSITAERANKVNFSKPYYKSGLSVIVKSNNNTIKGFSDLVGKKIAVQIGTTSATEAKKIKDTTVREFNTATEAFLELKNGGVDAVLNDLPVNEYYLAQGGAKDAKIAGEAVNAEDYGFATAKKNTELAQKITKALDELKQNGEYDKIYTKWFGKKQ